MLASPVPFFNLHPDPMWIFDEETLAILEANPAASDCFGHDRESLEHMHLTDLHQPHDIAALRYRLARRQGERVAAGVWKLRHSEGHTLRMDMTLQALDRQGRRVWLAALRDVGALIDLAPHTGGDMTPSEGAPDALSGTHSELSAANRRLERYEAGFRTAQRLLSIGMWSLNLETQDIAWSRNVYDMIGQSPETFRPCLHNLARVLHPEDRAETIEKLRGALDDAGALPLELRMRIQQPDGRIRHLHAVAETLESGSHPALTGVIQDVTAENALAKELEVTREIQRIAGRIGKMGGWQVDTARRVVRWTRETAAIHEAPVGWQPTIEQALDFYLPEDRPRMSALVEEALATGRPFDGEFRIRTMRGNFRWVRTAGEAARTPDGKLRYLRGAFQDVTDVYAAREERDALDRRVVETLESISDAFFTLDRAWRFTYLNSQAEALLGQPRDALLGHTFWEEFPKASGTSFYTQYLRAVASGDTARFVEYFDPPGVWLMINAYPSHDGMAVYFRDITQERADQQQLRLLETAASRMEDALVISEADSDGGAARIVYVNEAFERTTGYSRDEALNSSADVLEGLALAQGLLPSGMTYQGEQVTHAKDGSKIWLDIRSVPIASESGELAHQVSVLRNVTARKHAEAALRMNEERFRLLASAARDVVWDWDVPSGKIWWNEAMEKVFGHDPKTFTTDAAGWLALVHPDDFDRVSDELTVLTDGGGEEWSSDFRFATAAGGYVHAHGRAFVIRSDSGAVIRVLGSLADITERRLAETRQRQSQKLEAIGQLTGGVAHDFNNLLTIILGNSELLLERLEKLGEEQLREMAQVTEAAALRGSELTNRLLAFSRQQTLAPQPVDLNALVAATDAMLRRTLSENIEIRLAPDENLWTAELDPGQFEVALLNLAINARDAMPEGGKLTIETANATLDDRQIVSDEGPAAGDYVLLTVSDTGIGMPSDVVERAFEPFFTTKRHGKGSGLGLSMVYGFVKQSGGHVRIYSEPGDGTAFCLYFPRIEAPRADPATRVEPEDRVRGGEESVLVVEDDPQVRTHVQELLRGLGYGVTGAASGPEALERLKSDAAFDLLLTDVVMPGGMNGRQLAEAASPLRPGLKVLYMSGYTENAIAHHGRLPPGVSLLGKPFRKQDLARKLREVLDE